MPQPKLTAAQIAEFEAIIGYHFTNENLLIEALTHASRGWHGDSGFFCNERLEFLGDRVLGLIVAEQLFHTFPAEAVGSVAARFAKLVDRETLHVVAMEIRLELFLRYVPEQGASAGRRTVAPLADACEAVIGAIYLDGGFNAARTFVQQRWSRWIDQDVQPRRDAKSKLQEWAQGHGLPRPVYREVSRSGPPHLPVFKVEVAVDGYPPVEGEGYSKREAEQGVAEKLLTIISNGPPRTSL